MSRAGLQQVSVGVGWDQPPGVALDLDLAAFVLPTSAVVTSDTDFVFFNNLAAYNGAVRLNSDRSVRTGWREELTVDTAALPAAVDRVAIGVSSYGGQTTFGDYPAGFVELSDSDAGLLARCDLQARFGGERALIYADLRRDGDRWILAARGERFDDLGAMARSMGVKV
ncbi:TerD family protein [Gordonia sp. X0973]|uniref:TerD family protein n=1 Tax=Gordonia sp. X0973 TaxID=2742602 RepID=UPI000F543DAD|nr:TerD family protein [Gordonia sp. X0973]QKT08152.1 TerD family protein [Gordonia sp. X0973]